MQSELLDLILWRKLASIWEQPIDLSGIWTTRPKDNSPQTISPQIYQPYNVLAVCFLPGFSTNDSILYVLVVYVLQTFLRCVEIIVFIFEVKAKERLVESVKMQSEICERRWNVLLEQNDHM